MKTIQLQIDEKNFETFMTIIKNLKNGMIKNLEIKDNDFEQSKLYFNQCLEDIESNKTKLFTQDAYQKEMNDFMKKLEQKYDNNQRWKYILKLQSILEFIAKDSFGRAKQFK